MDSSTNKNESANTDRQKGKFNAALKKTGDACEQAEKNLSISEDRYRTLFDESTDGIIMTSPKGTIWEANSACARMIGYPTVKELLMESAYELYMCPEDRDTLIRTIMRQGFVRNYEVEMKHKDEYPLVVSMNAKAILNRQGKIEYIQNIVKDMTTHRLLERQLIESQKMENIGRLAGGVAHDFNNFLTAIQGNIDLARMKLPEDSRISEELKEARASSKRAANLARQLLMFSRREPVNKKPVSLNKVVDNLLNMLEHIIGDNFSIKTELADELWIVNADTGHLEQVLMNLVINARDAMQGGGTIVIGTGNLTGDPRFVTGKTGKLKRRFVQLSVMDSGTGMDAETQSRIFEPFFTTKEVGTGTGLGLSVVYGIITQHQGWIDIDSVQGGGSTFVIYLPVIAEIAAAAPAEETAESLIAGRGQRILLVEDEAAVMKMTEKALVENEFDVITAANAESALRVYDREDGRFDMVFSDVVLPNNSGIWLVEQLRGRRPDLPVLMASGFADLPVYQAINKQGYWMVQKPYDIFEVMRIISNLTDGSQSVA